MPALTRSETRREHVRPRHRRRIPTCRHRTSPLFLAPHGRAARGTAPGVRRHS